MAVAALHLFPGSTDILGVLKGQPFGRGRIGHISGPSLGQDSVTRVAALGDGLSVLAPVQPIVTSVTAGEVQMADIVRMRIPTRFHVGKVVSPVNFLDRRDGA